MTKAVTLIEGDQSTNTVTDDGGSNTVVERSEMLVLKHTEVFDGGSNGESAFEIAVNHGFSGTEQDWLDSLEGPEGPQGKQGDPGVQGETGPANSLTIGTVTKGVSASATITGTAPTQVLNLVLPKGDKGSTGPKGKTGDTGPANELSIGTVQTGITSSAEITGTAPNQVLNLTLEKGIQGDTGSSGPANTLSVGTVQSGSSADATITGTAPAQTLNLMLPRGDAATVAVGATTTKAAGTDATVSNSGTSSAAVFDFAIPKGDKGEQGKKGETGDEGKAGPANSLSIGTVSKGTAADASISGSAPDQILSLTLPKGDKGDTGATGGAATVAVGTTTTGDAGTNASVSNSGTSSAAVFDFTIPRGEKGDTGDTGPANQLSIGTVTGGATADATLTGSAPNQTLNLTLPNLIDGADQIKVVSSLPASPDPNVMYVVTS